LGDEGSRAPLDFADEFAEGPTSIAGDQGLSVAVLGGRPHDLRDGEHYYFR